MKYLFTLATLAMFMLFPSVGYAQMTTVSIDDLLLQIQNLTSQIAELQKKVGEVKIELRTLLKDNLKEGMSDEDIKKIQEILATDSEIYPQGLVTGYFGPLTKNALRNFQHKFNLKITGEIDEDTKLYLEELLSERFGDKIPHGLLGAPGIQKKIELKLKNGCDGSVRGIGSLCKELKIKSSTDDEDDDNEGLKIEVEIEDERAKVKIEYENGVKKIFIFDITDHDEIVDEITNRTTLTKEEIDAVIKFGDDDDDDDDDSSDS